MAASTPDEPGTRGLLLLAAQARKGATCDDSRRIIMRRIDQLLDAYLVELEPPAVTITA